MISTPAPNHKGRSGEAPENALQVNLPLVLYAIRRWWRIALPSAVVLAVVAGLAVATFSPPAYRAAAWVKIEELTPMLAFEQKDSPRFVQTQIQLMKSPLVLAPVLEQPEVASLKMISSAKSPLEWLGDRVDVTSVGGSELYHVTFDSPDAAVASMLLNTIVDSYMTVQTELEDRETQRTVELLDSELSRRAQDLEEMQANLKELARKVTGDELTLLEQVDTDDAALSVTTPIMAINQRLAAAQVERELMQARLSALDEPRTSTTEMSPDIIDQAASNDADVKRLTQELETLRATAEAHTLREGWGPNHPVMLQVAAEQKRKEELLAEAKKKAREQVAQHAALGAIRESQQTKLSVSEELQTVTALEGILRGQLDEHRERIQRLGDHSLELEFARADVEREEMVFNLISDRVTALRTEIRAPGRVTLLRRSSDAEVTLRASPLTKVGLGSGVAFALPFLLAVAWERRSRRVSSTEQVSESISLPLIAEVAEMPLRTQTARSWRGHSYQRQQAVFEESINLLRTSLVLPDEHKDLQVLAVASAATGEGKTSVICQLAVSLARATKERVLLIDADMRAPDVHGIFELPLEPGLAEVLSGELPLRHAIQHWSSQLDVLTAGCLRRAPDRIVTTEVMTRLLESLRRKYRYILIDSPPLLAASEAFVVARVADGAILCTMRDVSRLPQVRYAIDRLIATGVTPLGVVLSNVPQSDYDYRYGSYGASKFWTRKKNTQAAEVVMDA